MSVDFPVVRQAFGPHPVIGQEAITPDGLGRVTAYVDRFPEQWVQVSTYVRDRQCKWSPDNVQLVDIGQTTPLRPGTAIDWVKQP